jgi:hypothetical protein
MALKPATLNHIVNYVFTTKITHSFRRLSVPFIVILLSAARKPGRKNGLETHDLTVTA